jgi:hypothetical protein
MKRFDEDGNFVNPPKPEYEEELQQVQPINYVYIYNEENTGSEKDSD